MKYTKEQKQSLRELAESIVEEINANLRSNVKEVYGKSDLKEFERYSNEVDEYIKENTVGGMLEYIIEYGEDNEIPFDELEGEFWDNVDQEVFGFPECPLWS
jgi:hypothetical protein